MRQADKNRADKAHDLVAQAEKKLREIKWENLDGQQSYLRQRVLNKFQELRWALSDFINDKSE